MTLAPHPVGVELLDDPAAPRGAVRESLRNIARANRWFGGRGAVRWGLRHVPLASGAPIVLLDIGAGTGDLTLDAARRMGSRGITVRPVVLETHPEAVSLCRTAGLFVIRGDAGALPLADRSVDVVLLSQILHHFSRESAKAALGEARRIARRAIVIADLRRSTLAVAAFHVGARMLGFDPATRADGVTSIRRGFHPRELAALLAEAGLPALVRRRPGWRLVAVARMVP
ncbi:MAG TPA: methyltransferase domain-containing protein [Gemmatimonadales bacterium]|nr:methyltransferase domain-containing protein [Gemmatimonadales bacterium]